MLTLAAAAEACGVHKVTALKWIQRGKISATKNDAGEWEVDPSELARAGLLKQQRNGSDNAQRSAAPETAAVLQAEVQGLRELNAALNSQIADLKCERDKWADQARIAVQALPAPDRVVPADTTRPWWRRLAG